jgi:hypothetical protein
MKKIFLGLLLLFSISIFAQKIDKQNALVTIRGNVGIPKSLGSQMFRTCFNGVYEANLSVNVRLAGNFFAGGGYQNTFFQNNREVFVFYRVKNGSLAYETKMMGNAGFIKLGFDKFFSERGYVSYSVNSGLMSCNYLNVNNDTSAANKPFVSTRFMAPYVQPEISLNVIVDKTLSFSFMLSYTTMFYKFDPKAPRFNHVEEVFSKRNNYFMNWFNFGLGFHVLLDKKAKT